MARRILPRKGGRPWPICRYSIGAYADNRALPEWQGAALSFLILRFSAVSLMPASQLGGVSVNAIFGGTFE